MTDPSDDKPVTKGDIEGKLREIKGEVDEAAEGAKPVGMAVGVGVGLVALVLVYLMGRRRGKKKTTIVEVRRA